MKPFRFLRYCVVIIAVICSCSSPSDGNKTFTLKTNVEPTGAGVVTPPSGTFPSGESVTLQAESNNGWMFIRWDGDISGDENPVTFSMIKNQSVKAVFEKRNYPLNIVVDGEGSVQEEVIAAKEYPFQTTVQLTAIPETGWVFTGWEGDIEETENPVQILIDEEKNVKAIFEEQVYAFSVLIEGEGSVEEEIVPAKELPYGTVVRLTAIPEEGWRFEAWSGVFDSADVVVEITITNDVELTATFIRREYDLNIETMGEGSVQEQIVPEKTYPYQTTVQLTAIAAADWEFAGWSGDLTGTQNPVEIIIDDEKNVTATFNMSAVPEVTTLPATNIASMSAKVSGTVTPAGITGILERGICYSTDKNPSVEGNCVISEQEQDHFTSDLLNLQPLTKYHARAYVMSDAAVYYGNDIQFTTIFDMDACGVSVFITHHTSDGVSPQNQSIQYATVFYENMCWLVQNLGANSAASSGNDHSTEAAGWYWQFNKKQGYKNDGDGPVPQWQIHEIEENRNWREENDPCTEIFGENWRIPTISEWQQSMNWQPQNIHGAYSSPLNIHAGGILGSSSGSLTGRGSAAIFWSSSQHNEKRGQAVRASESVLEATSSNKANGRSVRCVYTEHGPNHLPNLEITDIKENTPPGIELSVRVINSGTSSIQDKGVCYSTSPEPGIHDSCISEGVGSSNYTVLIDGLTEGETYYARAYAVNHTGRAYSTEVSFEGVSGEQEEIMHDVYVYALAAPDLTKEIFINWIDDSEDADGSVQIFRYGTGESFNKETSATGKKIPHASSWVYSVKLTNLNPATSYVGRIHKTETTYTIPVKFETLPVSITGPETVRIAFMSDIHIDEDEPASQTVPGNPVNSMHNPAKMGVVQQKNIDVLSIAGDIVSRGYTVDNTRTEQYIGFIRDHIHTYLNADKLVPLFVVPGNHEVGFPLRGEGGFTEPTPGAGYFQLLFNNLYETTNSNHGVARAGNYLQLIGLDMFSSTPEIQRAFFDANVSSSVSGVIPFFHSPMLEGGVRSPEDVQYSDHIRKQLAVSFAAQTNIYSYFTGHLHLKFRSKPWNVIEAATKPPQSLSLGNNKYLVADESRNRLVEFGQGYRSNREPYTTEDKTWYIDDASRYEYNVFFTVTLQSGKHIVTEYNHNGSQIYSKDLRGSSN